MQECKDSKTCTHATVLFERDRADRFSASYKPHGFVRCRGPRYKGRSYFVRDNRAACADYQRRERGAAE
jgi:hypothetical protein